MYPVNNLNDLNEKIVYYNIVVIYIEIKNKPTF